MGAAERVSRRRIIAAGDKVAEGLEAMSEAVEAQDKIIQEYRGVANDAHRAAAEASHKSNQAVKMATSALETLEGFRNQSFFERVAWLFRGPV